MACAAVARPPLPAAPQAADAVKFALAALQALTVPFSALQTRLLHLLMASLQWQAALPAWGTTHAERGILGAVVFDTFGFHIPAERMTNGRWRRRTNVGYISNMAVAPAARRCVRLLAAPPIFALAAGSMCRWMCCSELAHGGAGVQAARSSVHCMRCALLAGKTA